MTNLTLSPTPLPLAGEGMFTGGEAAAGYELDSRLRGNDGPVSGAKRRNERTGLPRAFGPRNDGSWRLGRLGVLLIPVLCLLIPGCASTDYKHYLTAQHAAIREAQAAQKPLVELEAMPGQAITGLKALRVYMPVQAPVIQQSRPSEWAGVLGQGLAIGGTVLGIKYAGDAAVNLSDSVGRAANAGYPFIQAPQANQSIGGSGVIGSGSYRAWDATSTPTVVSQPSPTVVTQPSPTVVTQPAPVVVEQPAPMVVEPAYPPVAAP